MNSEVKKLPNGDFEVVNPISKMSDLRYFQYRVQNAADRTSRAKAKKQQALMQDAIELYRIARLPETNPFLEELKRADRAIANERYERAMMVVDRV
jgi:hypothetical protein